MRNRGPRAKVMRRFGVALAPSTISERMRRSRQMALWADRGGIVPPPYLELDRDQLSGKLVRAPERDEIPIPIDDRLIVEFYSR